MADSTVEVPVSVLLWIATSMFAMIGTIGSICAHTLINMYKKLNEMSQMWGEHKVGIEKRMEVLERHDAANLQEGKELLNYLTRENAKA